MSALEIERHVSHLLAASDALITDRWGTHITLRGLEVRARSHLAATAAAATQDDDDDCDSRCGGFRYCPACVQEAERFCADSAASADDSSGFFIDECGHRRPIWPAGRVGGCPCDQDANP